MGVKGTPAKMSEQCSLSLGGRNEYTWTYSVETDSANDDEFTVLSALPGMLESHPNDLAAVVRKRTASRSVEKSPTIWAATIVFSSEPVSQKDQDREKFPNPLDRPPDIDWSYSLFQKPMRFTIDTPPLRVANVNHEEYSPLPEIDDARPVLTIKRNEATFSASLQLQYGNTLNTKSFYGASARQAKMLPPKATRKIEGDVTYWEVTYEIHFNKDTWRTKLIHTGLMGKNPSDGQPPITIKDGENREITEPVPLDASGNRLAEGAELFTQEFKFYREVDWSSLGLGS